jgi:hypothetical protein
LKTESADQSVTIKFLVNRFAAHVLNVKDQCNLCVEIKEAFNLPEGPFDDEVVFHVPKFTLAGTCEVEEVKNCPAPAATVEPPSAAAMSMVM